LTQPLVMRRPRTQQAAVQKNPCSRYPAQEGQHKKKSRKKSKNRKALRKSQLNRQPQKDNIMKTWVILSIEVGVLIAFLDVQLGSRIVQ
jgi:hypothetical protein